MHERIVNASILGALFALMVILSGCGSSGQGHISGGAAPILWQEPVDLTDYESTAYVMAPDAYVARIRELGIFARVIDAHEMEEFVAERGIDHEVAMADTPAAWRELTRHYGPFLVITDDHRYKRGQSYRSLKAIDPRSGDTVFFTELALAYPDLTGSPGRLEPGSFMQRWEERVPFREWPEPVVRDVTSALVTSLALWLMDLKAG